MNRFCPITFVLAISLVACQDDPPLFDIQQINEPPADCESELDVDAPAIASGVLDVSVADEFVLTPVLRNRHARRDSEPSLVGDLEGILVEGAAIRIWHDDRTRGTPVHTFYQPAASYVPPESRVAERLVAVPSAAVAALMSDFFEGRAVPALTFAELAHYRDEVTVGVTMVGVGPNNLDVRTPEFHFGVRLCFGCLVTCTEESADFERGFDYCANPTAPTDGGCFVGQQRPFDCRYCTPLWGAVDCRSHCDAEE